jgi:hypothetical protein
MLNVLGLLFVGDCKMSALATRGVFSAWQQYLCPLALIGENAELLRGWVQAALNAKTRCSRCMWKTRRGRVLLAKGTRLSARW